MVGPKGATNLWAATGGDNRVGRRHDGEILTVDPVAHVVNLAGANVSKKSEIPVYGPVGRDGEGWFGTPMPGWYGLTDDSMGLPGVSHFIPKPRLFDEGAGAERDSYSDSLNTWLALTGTPNTYRLWQAQSRNFRSNRPGDLIAGDQGFRTAEGAAVYALRGGVVGMKASPLCQILFDQVDDLARLVSRNLDIFTDWGQIQVTNDHGSARLRLRGSHQASQTYAGKHGFELVVGGKGPMLSLSIYAPAGADEKGVGQAVATLTVDQFGNEFLMLAGGQRVIIQGDQGSSVAGNCKQIVIGNAAREIHGTDKQVLKGSQTIKGVSSAETWRGAKTITAPTVNVGGKGGQPAVMLQPLEGFLKQLVDFLNENMVVMTPNGPAKPGALGIKAPKVPPLNSKVVFIKAAP